MGVVMIAFSLFISLVFTVSDINGKTFCVPDVTLPRSCKGRTSSDTPSGTSLESEVTFILYTPKYETNATEITVGDESSFTQSGYDTNEETKIIVHGYYSSAKNFEHMVNAYLMATKHNVVLMDWSKLADWCYCEHVLKNIENLGKVLGKAIEFLVRKGTPLNKIHIIGHSLGAHIAGIGSISCSAGKVGRITALDPARPGFSDAKNPDRLEKTRADLVDVIHSSAHTFGIAEDIGHFDFYPNGGQSPQPGCSGGTAEVCSHSRAHYLFAESITTDVGFRGTGCSSWTNYLNGICTDENAPTVNMGARLDKNSKHGTYYLKTGPVCPYFVLGSTSTGIIIMPSILVFLSLLILHFLK